MGETEDHEELLDIGLAIILARSLHRWKSVDLAERSGVDKGLISDYEAGKTRPSRKTWGRLAEGLGVDVPFLDGLVPVCRGLRLAFESAVGQAGAPGAPAAEGFAPDLAEPIAAAVREALAPYLLQLARLDRA